MLQPDTYFSVTATCSDADCTERPTATVDGPCPGGGTFPYPWCDAHAPDGADSTR